MEVTPEYLKNLPVGTSRGPQPSTIELWRIHDYGPFLSGSIEVGKGKKGLNVARKGLAVRLDPGADGIGRGHMWILYELDTLRAAAIWDGENFIDWQGINFNGSHNTHPHIDGRVIASLDTMPGWADPATGSFEDPRPLGRDQKPYGPLPASHARFKALHHAGDAILLEYDLHGTRVLEMAKLEAGRPEGEQSSPVVTRVWSVKPHTSELFVRVASVGEEAKGDEKTRQTVAAIVGQQASKPTDSAAFIRLCFRHAASLSLLQLPLPLENGILIRRPLQPLLRRCLSRSIRKHSWAHPPENSGMQRSKRS